MSEILSTLTPPAGSRRKRKRVGRGPGSGHGKTSGRGHKGRYARSGSGLMVHKEGGQMPLYRRLPKRGFYNHFRVEYQVVNLDALAAQESVSTFDVPTLRRLRLIRFADRPVKILGRGDIGRAINVSAHAFARSAQEKIASAGGRCQTITTKTPATAGKKTA